MKKRGLEMNMPFDVRSTAYSSCGDDAQINLKNIWDVEFWKVYFDDMARYRYNVLILWTLFLFTNMIDIPEYKDCAMEDVFRATPEYLTSDVSGRFQKWDLDGDGNIEEYEFEGDKREKNKNLQLLKRMTIEEKNKKNRINI